MYGFGKINSLSLRINKTNADLEGNHLRWEIGVLSTSYRMKKRYFHE